MINTLFNPLYNRGQIKNFTDYLLHPQVTPLIENKTLTVHYVIMDKNGKVYPSFHRTVNEFLGRQPVPNNGTSSATILPTAATQSAPVYKEGKVDHYEEAPAPIAKKEQDDLPSVTSSRKGGGGFLGRTGVEYRSKGTVVIPE